VEDSARLDVRKPLELSVAAARNVGNRAREALDTLSEGYPGDVYRAIYNANNLEPELAAVRDAFAGAGVSPSL
jgi:hypothetical protein